jgi:hypothetical protein
MLGAAWALIEIKSAAKVTEIRMGASILAVQKCCQARIHINLAI